MIAVAYRRAARGDAWTALVAAIADALVDLEALERRLARQGGLVSLGYARGRTETSGGPGRRTEARGIERSPALTGARAALTGAHRRSPAPARRSGPAAVSPPGGDRPVGDQRSEPPRRAMAPGWPRPIALARAERCSA